MDRREEQLELIFLLGVWLGPVLEVVKSPDDYTQVDRANIRARANVDSAVYVQKFRAFCLSEPGHSYNKEMTTGEYQISKLIHEVNNHLDDRPDIVGENIAHLRPYLQQTITSVPVATDSAVYEAHTPFSTYVKVKSLCDTASRTLTLCDRYLDRTVFHRYLKDVDKQIVITLVTWPRARRGNGEFDEFLDVSKLFSVERGPEQYRLYTNFGLHDRWLRRDDQLFQFGGSFKDAASMDAYTLSVLEPTAENFQKVEDLIANSTEVFGAGQPNHS